MTVTSRSSGDNSPLSDAFSPDHFGNLLSEMFGDEGELADLVSGALADLNPRRGVQGFGILPSIFGKLASTAFGNTLLGGGHSARQAKMHGPSSCACRKDVRTFCLDADGVQDSVSTSKLSSALTKCLHAHSSELSDKCFASMDRMDISLKCSLEVDEFCEGVQPGSGRLHECLRSNEDGLGDVCLGYLRSAATAGENARQDQEQGEQEAAAVLLPAAAAIQTEPVSRSREPPMELEPARLAELEVAEDAEVHRRHLMILLGVVSLSIMAVVGLAVRTCRKRGEKERNYQLMMI